MIRNKYINAVIAVLVVAAVCFTAVFTFSPEAFGIVASSSSPDYASELFDASGIISVDITADPDEWENMIQNASSEEYISCDVTVNGTTFYSVGIRPKGNSSLRSVSGSSSPGRYSFKLEFDKYIKGQTCFGLDKLVLNNVMSDATYMKEYISFDIMNYIGVPTLMYSYADISVNDEDWGFYVALEGYEESFVQRTFGSNSGLLYNVKSMDMGGGNMENEMPQRDNSQAGGMPEVPEMPDAASGSEAGMSQAPPASAGQGTADGDTEENGGTALQGEGGMGRGEMGGGNMRAGGMGGSSGGDLVYTGDSSDSYSAIFGNSVFDSSESDYQRVITALENLSTGTDPESYFDVDEILRYLAAHTVVVNLDSYVSNMKQNYYLYEEDGKISILPWDYNLAFGGFQSGNASSVVNFAIDTPVSGVDMEERPLIAKLLEVDEYKEKYHQYLRQIVEGYFNSGVFESTVERVDALIGSYVQNDASAFYTYEDYQNALSEFKELCLLRAESIEGQLDGSIPSTTSSQAAEPDKLVDASSVELSALGGQGGGGNGEWRGGGRSFGNNAENGAVDAAGPGNTSDMPDMDIMRKAMEIIGETSFADLTEEQLSQLKALGLSDEQIEAFKNMPRRSVERTAMQMENGPDSGGNATSGRSQNQVNQPAVTQSASETLKNAPAVVLSCVFLIAGLMFVLLFKRKRYSV